MTPMQIGKATAHRLGVIARYWRSAPSLTVAGRWLFLGAIRARLTGGEARMSGTGDGKASDFHIQVGKEAAHQIRLDLCSLAELDSFEEVFVRGIYQLGKLPFQPTLVLDCGANIGLFASLCRMKFEYARIFCWEPEPGNFAQLKAQPLLQSSLVAWSQEAVSDADGQLLFIGDGLGGRIADENELSNQRVRAINLRSWMSKLPDEPTLIKIDIEGHEERVIPSLAGAWPRLCALFLETHQEPGKDAILLQSLSDEGFQWELLESHEQPHRNKMLNEYFAVRRTS